MHAPARLFEQAKRALRKKNDEAVSEKNSRYLEAGSPLCCYLPTCRKPFMGMCVHANDGHFYCSHVCADIGEKIDMSKVLLRSA
jgi:hypothetical protein